MCKCISRNRPNKRQTIPPRKMRMLCAIYPDGKKKYKNVFIDECIADDVQKLWDNGIFTLSSCCGHNGIFGKDFGKEVVLSDEKDLKKAKKLLPDFKFYYWKLITK